MERMYTTEELHVMKDLQHDVRQLKNDIENWKRVLRTEFILLNKEEMKKLAAQTVACSMTIIQNEYPIEMYAGVYEIYREELTEIHNYLEKN